jgi:predicted NAD/FAD-dependent oxidoreductase
MSPMANHKDGSVAVVVGRMEGMAADLQLRAKGRTAVVVKKSEHLGGRAG